MKRALLLIGLALLGACKKPIEPTGPSAPAAVVAVEEPAKEEFRLLNEASVHLLVQGEVGSQSRYERSFTSPVWPGGQSGVTIGVGYDLGQQRPEVISIDWAKHDDVTRLVEQSGVSGAAAKVQVTLLADIRTLWPLAYEVFEVATVPRYYRTTQHAFGKGFLTLPANAQGALVALVYNRGGSMAGERRREMRAIRDECIPASDVRCIAREIRAMVRIWIGTDIERGMRVRREAEAKLAESPT